MINLSKLNALSGALMLSGCVVCFGAADFSFGGPEIVKLDWTTRSLNACDVNRDGLKDLVLINQDTAQIELLYQRPADALEGDAKKRVSRNRWEPVLEDARYDREGVSVGFPVFDLSVGDLNGDGLVDMAYTAREVPLTIRYQSESGQWTELVEFDDLEALGWTSTVVIEDLNDDGRDELLVMAADGFRVYSHDAKGHLLEPKLYYLTGENPYNLLLEDVNGDALLDVLYITSAGKQSLAYREQLAEGGFGPERRFVFDRPVRVVRVMPRLKGQPLQFCSVDSRTGSLEFFNIEREDKGVVSGNVVDAQPEIYPIFKKNRLSASYVMGDINGDGQKDLAVANPSESEVVLFLKEGAGFHAPKRFPSFSAVSSMASGQFYKGDGEDVVMISADEKSIGISQMGEGGRLLFPKAMPFELGDPVVCEALDLDGDALDELLLIHEKSGKYELIITRPSNRELAESEWTVVTELKLAGVKRKPSAIRRVDIFGDERQGIMVFVPREAPLLYATSEAGSMELVEFGNASTIRQNLLKDVQPVQVSVFDVNSDGRNELIVGRKGFARAIRVVGEDLEMVDQFNARRGEDTVSAVVPLVRDGAVDRIMFYVRESGELQYLKQDVDGVYRYERTENVGTIDLLAWSEVGEPMSGGDIIFSGESQFWLLPTNAERWSKSVVETYETELEDVYFTHVRSADFNQDGALELIAVDGQNHIVEVLTRDDDEWNGKLYWEIFEQNMHYQGRTGGKLEPRQILIEDLNGDGNFDFAFLIHDRILIYLQE